MDSMAKEIAEGIVSVIGEIKTLAKEEKNNFAKYDFVSVDAFMKAVGPLCAKAGLAILQDETSATVEVREVANDNGSVKKSAWLTAVYSFCIAHKSGALYGPMTRTVMVPANGAQAYGSAQSYALKQFMRSLFQIPTGDKDDVDHQEPQAIPPQRQQRPQQPPKEGSPFDDAEPTDWVAYGDDILRAIKTCATQEEANDRLRHENGALQQMATEARSVYDRFRQQIAAARDALPKAPQQAAE